jgi:DNA-binding GntR family transcriptional regulator
MPHRNKRDALHQSIARTLREEIARGQPAIGGLLPGEHELCARFVASRHTVRDALRHLAQQGLIERRQGADTRVVADQPRGPYQPAMHSIEELRQYAAETVLRLSAVRMRVPDGDEVALLRPPTSTTLVPDRGSPAEQAWLQVDGVRWAGTERVCSNRVFINPGLADMFQDLAPGTTLTVAINEIAARRSGTEIFDVQQDIAARPMPTEAARSLGLPGGTTALLFVRRYRDAAGNVMVWSLSWHPADSFVYRMRLQRDLG